MNEDGSPASQGGGRAGSKGGAEINVGEALRAQAMQQPPDFVIDCPFRIHGVSVVPPFVCVWSAKSVSVYECQFSINRDQVTN